MNWFGQTETCIKGKIDKSVGKNSFQRKIVLLLDLQLHPVASSILGIDLIVIVLAAAVPLREHHHQEHGAQPSHTAPKPEDTADNGLDLAPIPVLVEGRVLSAG